MEQEVLALGVDVALLSSQRSDGSSSCPASITKDRLAPSSATMLQAGASDHPSRLTPSLEPALINGKPGDTLFPSSALWARSEFPEGEDMV